MSRFGTLAAEFGGDNRYRIIWAPSRKVIITPRHQPAYTARVYGAGPGGKPKSLRLLDYRPFPDAPLGECWLLEQWKAPWDYAGGGTKESWERNPLNLNMGPYPAKGEYDSDASSMVIRGTPSLELVEKMILMIEDGWKRHSENENQVAIQGLAEKGIRERDNRMTDRINNRSLIGAGETYSARGGGRGTKTVNTNRSAQDVGLPGIPGATSATKKKYKPREIPIKR